VAIAQQRHAFAGTEMICACIGSSRFRSFSFLQNGGCGGIRVGIAAGVFEHVLHVGGRLAVVAEQALATAALIESRERLVNAKRKRLSSPPEKTKG
jgi:hypothetical protein